MKISINIINYLKNLFYLKSETDTKLDVKSNIGHNHDDVYYTESEIDEKLNTKSDITHKHDDIYYTESEIDEKLNTKSNVNHNHDENYSKLDHNHDARYYTEEEIDNKFDALIGFEARVVTELPSEGELGVMYLILDEEGETGNIYKEFIYVNGDYEEIGTTETKLTVDSVLDDSSINPVQNKTIFEALTTKSDINHTHDNATVTTNGFLSSGDKIKLDSIAEGATNISVDDALNNSSVNPVQNKVIYGELKKITESSTNLTTDDVMNYINTNCTLSINENGELIFTDENLT